MSYFGQSIIFPALLLLALDVAELFCETLRYLKNPSAAWKPADWQNAPWTRERASATVETGLQFPAEWHWGLDRNRFSLYIQYFHHCIYLVYVSCIFMLSYMFSSLLVIHEVGVLYFLSFFLTCDSLGVPSQGGRQKQGAADLERGMEMDWW